MIELTQPSEAAAWCAGARSAGRTLGFVPTMGALHDGHMELVRRAVRENDVAVVSVFVNPLQFNDPRDFERYPRDFAGDARRLEGEGLALVFTGTLAGFFPGELRTDGSFDPRRLREPGPGALGLEGDHRPGHFAGVATIVERLFRVVRPTRAYFGRKDYQQTLVVRHLAGALDDAAGDHAPREPRIVVCPTSREPNGLARSSRNTLLTPQGLETATALSRGLLAARLAWRAGERDADRLRARLAEGLRAPGVEVEYGALRERTRWSAAEPTGALRDPIALVAARVEGVRLIDNLELAADELDFLEAAVARRARA